MASCVAQNEIKKHCETIDEFKQQNPETTILCFYNYIFTENEKYNGIGIIENSHIIKYEKYDKNDCDPEFLGNSYYQSIFDITKTYGIPFSYGIECDKSLDYSFDAETIYRLSFDEADCVDSIAALDKENPLTWIDEKKTQLPSIQDVDCLQTGMSLDKVITLIGKPQREIGSGAIIYEFDLANSDKKLIIIFENDTEKEIKYVTDNNLSVFGTHFLSISKFEIVD